MKKPPPFISYVPVSYVRAVLSPAQRRGLDVDAVLALANIQPDALNDSHARISVRQFSRVYLEISKLLDDEMLGLASLPAHRGTAEVLCRAACTGRDMLESASILLTAENLAGNLISRVVVTEDNIQLLWKLRRPAAEPIDAALAYLLMMLVSVAILTWLAGERLPLLRADLPFRPPSDRMALHVLLSERLRFGRPDARLYFSPSMSTMPLRRQPSDVVRFLRHAPASFIENMQLRGRTATRVRDLLRVDGQRAASIDEIARIMALSPRTLQRKLAQEGESFLSIRDAERCEFAINMLTRTSIPIKRLANDLGFADQGSFQRAFLAWTGIPPGEYRRTRKRQAKT